MYMGKTNWEIRKITGYSYNLVERVLNEAQILGIVRWNDKFNPYVINKERRIFIETFYCDFNKYGYSIGDLIECYKEKFKGYDVKKNKVRNIIKKKSLGIIIPNGTHPRIVAKNLRLIMSFSKVHQLYCTCLQVITHIW